MKKIFLTLFALVLIFIVFPASSFAAVTWTETQPAGDTNQDWTPMALSSDGQIMMVGVQSGRLYITTNGGDTWTETQPIDSEESDDHGWYVISMSSNGQVILAGVLNGRMYLSTNGGDSWSETRPGGDANYAWYTSSMSSNGQIILAGAKNGRLYKSTNSGTDWGEVQPAGNTNQPWSISTMTTDGQIMFAGMDAGRLYRSTNSGTDWGEVRPGGDTDIQWSSLGISADGQTVLAGALNGRLYRSTDGGDSWEEAQPAGDIEASWPFARVSSDGNTLFVGSNQRLYLSNNGGDSWSETQPMGDTDQTWGGGNMSSDSQVLVAGIYGGRIFIGSNPLPVSQSSNNSVYNPPAGFGPPSCNDSAPSAVPDLFRIDPAGSYVNLYFSTVKGSTGYNVNYGLTPDANQYGDNFGYSGDLWNIGRTISGLSPNTTYYFRVQAVNGCNAGAWSPVKSVKTKGRSANVSQWFANLNPFSSNPSLITSKSSGQAVAGVSKTPGSCSYVVQEGDSFWRIASEQFGSGARFGEIQGLNPGVLGLRVGQIISVCK